MATLMGNEDPDGATLGQRCEMTPEERELGMTVQHLSVQNMYLTRAAQDAQRKLQQEQRKVRALELKLQSLNQECFTDKNIKSTEEEIQLLKFAKAQDCLKIEGLESQLSSLRLTSVKCEVCTQTEDITGVEAARNNEITSEDEDHHKKNSTDMDEFREEMKNRREARHRAIGALSAELERLRSELCTEKQARKMLQEQADHHLCGASDNQEHTTLHKELEQVKQELVNENIKNQNIVMQCKSLENVNEDLSNSIKEETLKFESKLEYYKKQIGALKEVASLSKQMLTIRESQVADLKCKVKNLQEETSSEGHEDCTAMKTKLDSQVQSIVELKNLYENRITGLEKEIQKLTKESESKSTELEMSQKTCSDVRIRLEEIEVNDLEREEYNKSLQAQLELASEERKSLSNELVLINSIFTQMLVANSSTDMDLDKLAKMLQENHDLITEMTTKENGNNNAAGLPKLLLELINQIDNEETPAQLVTEIPENSSVTETVLEPPSECSGNNKEEFEEDVQKEREKIVDEDCSLNLGVEEIASNLPKVWRILMELVSHHKVPTPGEEHHQHPSCYKCIETPSGPRFVPSVSNTYIRLKDLILEKKYLQKDLGKLKQLNSHLESKLQEQEKRLTFVSAELKKTWGVVGKLRSQYKQLHTHEQILRYELQQKRHLLTELKTELEYCREKWERAREMNDKTEIEWKKLRKEFAERKKQDESNSGESGFSDDRENDSGDEEEKKTVILGSSFSSPAPQTLPADKQGEATSEQFGTEVVEISQCHLSDTCPRTLPNDLPWQLPSLPSHLLTNLKEQLHLCSQTLNSLFNKEIEKYDERQALQSIFSLPPIQIPVSLTKKTKVLDSVANTKQTKETRVPIQPERLETQPSKRCIKEDRLLSSPEEKQANPEAGKPCASSDNVPRDALGRTPEEALAARAARLKRLEEQTQLLFNKVTRTTNLSNALNNRLEELHEQYGVPNPPPLPLTLPAIRIPVQLPSIEQPTNDRDDATTSTMASGLPESGSPSSGNGEEEK